MMRTAEYRRQLPHRRRGREGAILAAALIVMLLVGIMGIALIQLGEFNGRETVRQGQKNQAFWSAEAGLSHMIALLRIPSYRDAPPYATNVNVMGMTYYVFAVSNAQCLFTITSTGFVGQSVEVVRQSIVFTNEWPAALKYGIFVGTNFLDVKAGSLINGDVFYAGDYTSDTNGLNVNGAAYDTNSPPPGGVPPNPVVSTASYSNLIAQAAASGSLVTATNGMQLTGLTNYFKGNLDLNGDVRGPGGMIVVNGNLNVGQGAGNLFFTNNVTVVVRDGLTVGKSFAAGSNCVLYAGGGMIFAQEATIGKTNGGCALITPSSLWAKNTLEFYGLVFVDGGITLDKESTIVGCVIANGGFPKQIDKNLSVTFNSSALPDDLSSLGFTQVTNVYPGVWQQVFQ